MHVYVSVCVRVTTEHNVGVHSVAKLVLVFSSPTSSISSLKETLLSLKQLFIIEHVIPLYALHIKKKLLS